MKDEKLIKVKILASPHQQFDEILEFPPKKVRYEIDRVKTEYHGWFTEKKIQVHNLLLSFLPIPRMTHTKTNADIVHSTRGIIQLFQNKPWILDCESGGVFTSFNYNALNNPLTKKIIQKALLSKNCKKILPQSEAAREDLEYVLGKKFYNKIKNKVEVLYLAMRPCKEKKIKRKDKKVVLSYVGLNSIYGKGGHDLLKAYEILTKKYKNLELKYKGDLPEKYLNFAKKLIGFKLVKGFLPRDKFMKEMYLGSDIFVLPTHQDNYGVVYLDAMSAGLPLVGTTSFTVPELIRDGKNGFLIETPYSWENYRRKDGKIGLNDKKYEKNTERVHPEIVKQLVEKLSILIENKKLREKMGKENRKMVEDRDGKFSIERRNKQLKRIYEEALK